MGITQHYLKDKDFLLTRIIGDLNNDTLFEHVLEVNKKNAERSNVNELADCRGITNLDGLTVPGTIASANAEMETPGSLLAILVTESALQFGMARAYQTFSADKRKAVEIFKDINEALSWLANDEQEAETLRSFVESIK